MCLNTLLKITTEHPHIFDDDSVNM